VAIVTLLGAVDPAPSTPELRRSGRAPRGVPEAGGSMAASVRAMSFQPCGGVNTASKARRMACSIVARKA
jgi:hypothetical protein